MITRRTLEGAEKWLFRDLRREDARPGETGTVSILIRNTHSDWEQREIASKGRALRVENSAHLGSW